MGRFDYEFSSLLGRSYTNGPILFVGEDSLLTCVHNRLLEVDLQKNQCKVMPFYAKHNIKTVCVSHSKQMVVVADVHGHIVIANLFKKIQISQAKLKSTIEFMQFSPNDEYISICMGRQTQIYRSPGLLPAFKPLDLYRTYTGHTDDITCMQWSPCGTFFATGAFDHTVRIYTVDPVEGYVPLVLTGHMDVILGVFFGGKNDLEDGKCWDIYSVGRDGSLFVWNFHLFNEDNNRKMNKNKSHIYHRKRTRTVINDNDNKQNEHKQHRLAKGSYKIYAKHYFNENVSTCSMYRSQQKDVNILVAGFTNGHFGLYELPTFQHVHSLSVSSQSISTCDINSTGQWLAIASADLGQLLVWDWQTETYVIKQQGHFFDVNDICYSPDGQVVASGSDDGKVKLWNATSGFCFITFTDHSAPVTGITFAQNGNILFSSSLDGTVRAYDLVRYRNFRTFTSLEGDKPVQFTCLAIEPSGEVVVAGTLEPFNIYVWSLRTGKLIDILSGHEAPVSGLAFTPVTSLLASSGWDGNVMIWDVFTGKGLVEVLGGDNPHDLLTLAFRPDGKELCTSCLDGNLYFWDVFDGKLKFSINGKRDMRGGRQENQSRTSKNSTNSLAFTSICYSSDGNYVLCGGNSKYICIYQISERILMKKFSLSENMSLDGMREKLNSRFVTDSGFTKKQLLENNNTEEIKRNFKGHGGYTDPSLPGVRKADLSSRNTSLVMRSKSVRFSPTGQQWAAATTEGVVIYSLESESYFDPLELDLDITPDACYNELNKQHYSSALVIALCLNEQSLIGTVIEKIPYNDIKMIISSIPTHRLVPLLKFLSSQIGSSPHLHFYLLWMQHLFSIHGGFLKNKSNELLAIFRSFQKNMASQRKEVTHVCTENRYLLDYLCDFDQHNHESKEEEDNDDNDNDDDDDETKGGEKSHKKQKILF